MHCAADRQDNRDLAHGLGLVATAEGVETVEQLRAVRELGCDVVQGFLVAAPLDPNDLIAWNEEFKTAGRHSSPTKASLYGAMSKRMP